MPKSHKTIRSLLSWGLMVGFLAGAGCASSKADLGGSQPVLPGIHKVVVIGFSEAVAHGSGGGWVRDPIAGAFVQAQPVPPQAVTYLSQALFERLAEKRGYDLISPSQAGGVYLSLLESDRDVGLPAAAIVRKVGEAFGADAVLTGYVFRWSEREGAEYGVSRPASVSFNLYMVRPSDGTVLWSAAYDKTQKPLSENLFDVGTFVKGKGRWMSAEKLAEIGVEEMLSRMPLQEEPKGK